MMMMMAQSKTKSEEESMMLLFTCHCLNVQLTGIPMVPGTDSNDHHKYLSDSFFRDSKLLRVRRLDGIKINYEYLCLKRPLVFDDGDVGRHGDCQIIFCAVCEKETHTILKNDDNDNDDDGDMKPSSWLMVAAHSTLLCDPAEISALRSVSNYSKALDIVLPAEREIDVRNNIVNSTIPSYIQMDIQDKIKKYLQQEKYSMQERIKQYTQEQELHFKELWQATQESKNWFLKMIENIQFRHQNIENTTVHRQEEDDFFQDKENRAGPDAVVDDNYMYPGNHHHHLSGQKILIEENLSENGKNSNITADSDEFLFDIDDIDVQLAPNNGGFISSSDYLSETLILDQNRDQNDDQEDEPDDAEDDDDDDFDLQEQIFPLKESMMNSQQQKYRTMDGTTGSGGGSSSMSYSMMSSGAMAIRREHWKSSGSGMHHIANSLPIQIPHNLARTERDMEESFRLNPGESIADSIQKLARSVRNETDILDDRPRRRLNTGDLIKSRPSFKN